MTNQETLILGIGNTLLTDDGSGIHALTLFQLAYPDIPNLTCLDGGTLSFTLASWIEDCDNLIVFDAAELHQATGTVKTLIGDDMDRFLGAAKRSAHEVGLLDLFDIARLTYSLPRNRALIGIQPEEFGWGMQPCEAVQQALPLAVDEARRLIESWRMLDEAVEAQLRTDIGVNNPALESPPDAAGKILQ
jgi:hydrogenase maturation protease